MPLILREHDLNVIKWWVDASHNMDTEFRSHNGGNISFGSGSIISISKQKKKNNESAMEADIAGADYVLTGLLRTMYSIHSQGFDVVKAIMYQENMSAILLGKWMDIWRE